MDLNLDTLKREISDYLETSGFAVFHGQAGELEGFPVVLWDTERYPDYQVFLETARRAGVNLVIFSSREFELAEVEEAQEQLQECSFSRDESRDAERRLREFRAFEGVTCLIELAFDYNSRLYVYALHPDWYEEFMDLGDEIMTHLPGGDESPGPMGGYFSRN